MADEEDVIEAPEVEVEEEEVEQPQDEADQQETDVSEGAPEDDGLVVEIGGEDEAPEWVKELRRANREKDKELKELRARVNAPAKQDAVPEKPTLESCDYDSADFEKKLEEWYDLKREHDAKEAEAKALADKAQQRWEAKVTAYDEGKEKLGAPDFDEAEATVSQIFDKPFPGIMADDVRMGIIKQGAKDPSLIVYALGKNPEKAKQLAEIDDPVEFAFALGEMSGKMKAVRTSKPDPERKITGTKPGVTAADNTLERLREEASKTGDFTKVMAYKRQKRG